MYINFKTAKIDIIIYIERERERGWERVGGNNEREREDMDWCWHAFLTD